MAWQSSALSATKYGSGFFGKIFAKIPWKWLIAIVFVVITLFNSIIVSIQEKNFSPIIHDVGGLVFNQERVISNEVDNLVMKKEYIEENQNLMKLEKAKINFNRFSSYWKIFASIYILGILVYILFYVVQWIPGSNASNWGLHLVFALLFLAIVETLFMSFTFTPDVGQPELRDMNFKQQWDAVHPFQGVIKLAQYSPQIFSTAKQNVNPILKDFLNINSSIQNTSTTTYVAV